MGNRPSCRSCRHCLPPSATQPGWCQLRRLPIHQELVSELWCHHWTARPPLLPEMSPQAGAPEAVPEAGHQLRLTLAPQPNR